MFLIERVFTIFRSELLKFKISQKSESENMSLTVMTIIFESQFILLL